MELIQYLNENFLTKQELLEITKVSEQALLDYQQQELMPQCSYRLDINIRCDSFFGQHQEQQDVEYYAKGYVCWLGIVQTLKTKGDIYSEFSSRYIKAIEKLTAQGHFSSDPKINDNLELHIKEEWAHFLSGTYGLCTTSGLPEDIAAKELAILEINELIGGDELDASELERLTRAVHLLDQSSSMFAPHERLKSTRHRLIDEVRRQYQLLS